VSNFLSSSLDGGTRVQLGGSDGRQAVAGDIGSEVGQANIATAKGEGSSTAHRSGPLKTVIGGGPGAAAAWNAFEGSHEKFNSADITNGETDPILASAHNGSRGVSSGALKPTDWVRIGDIEVTVEAAVTMNYLAPNPNGKGYIATSKGRGTPAVSANVDPAVAAKAAEAAAQEKAAATVKGEMADLEVAAFKAADPHNAIGALAELPLGLAVGLLVKGQRGESLTSSQLDQLATHWKTDHAGSHAKITDAYNAATAQFVQACNLVGIDPTAAGEWIGKARSDTFMSVMQAATIRGNPSAWLSLLRDAKANGVR
jgi:hypothetical protein